MAQSKPKSQNKVGWLMALPASSLIILFLIVPFLLAFWFSFTNQRLVSPNPTEFVGWSNFSDLMGVGALTIEPERDAEGKPVYKANGDVQYPRMRTFTRNNPDYEHLQGMREWFSIPLGGESKWVVLAKDALFMKALTNTILFVVIVAPIQAGLALLLALLINQKLPGINLFRTIYFMGAHLQYPVNLLRDLMSEYSQDERYSADEADLWEEKVQRLFKSMRNGTPFHQHQINRFNGGLFAADDELDELHVPNKVFFAPFQGASNESLFKYKKTLLYFAANYNFGIEEGGERAIGLYTLGRIFEQSITDLEIMEAEAAKEVSLMKLSKRKTNGVYYTPEWATTYIVEETLGLRLRELKTELGLVEFEQWTDEQVDADHYKNGKLKKNSETGRYFDLLDTYHENLGNLKVLDPACGSGAFLIQALKRLLQEHAWR